MDNWPTFLPTPNFLEQKSARSQLSDREARQRTMPMWIMQKWQKGNISYLSIHLCTYLSYLISASKLVKHHCMILTTELYGFDHIRVKKVLIKINKIYYFIIL